MRVNRYLRAMSAISFVVHTFLAVYLFNVPIRPNNPVDELLYGVVPPRGYAAVVALAAILLLTGVVRWPRLMQAGWAIASFFWFAIAAVTALVAAQSPSQSGMLGVIFVGYILSFHIGKLFLPLYTPIPPPKVRHVGG